MGKKRDLQVLRTIDGETRTVGSSSPPDFLRYFDFPIFSYYYYITMFRCCCWNWFVGGSDDDRCRDSDDFGIAELTRAAATETVTPPDCVPFLILLSLFSTRLSPAAGVAVKQKPAATAAGPWPAGADG